MNTTHYGVIIVLYVNLSSCHTFRNNSKPKLTMHLIKFNLIYIQISYLTHSIDLPAALELYNIKYKIPYNN